MPELLIFRAGMYAQGNFPISRVKRMVDAYDPVNSTAAPVVIGHKYFTSTDDDQMAHGWVDAVRMDEQGNVYGFIPRFSAKVRAALADDSLRYISVEIAPDDIEDDTLPPYLAAVALLGRDTPAVAQARLPLMFSGGKGVLAVDKETKIVTFTRRLSAHEITSLSSDDVHGTPKEETYMDEATFRATLAEKDAELAAFKKEKEDGLIKQRTSEANAFYVALRDAGTLPPAQFARAIALDLTLTDEQRTEHRAIFSALSPQLDPSGRHMADKRTGSSVRDTLTATIRAFQAKHKMASFADAAAAMHVENPAAFEEGGDV